MRLKSAGVVAVLMLGLLAAHGAEAFARGGGGGGRSGGGGARMGGGGARPGGSNGGASGGHPGGAYFGGSGAAGGAHAGWANHVGSAQPSAQGFAARHGGNFNNGNLNHNDPNWNHGNGNWNHNGGYGPGGYYGGGYGAAGLGLGLGVGTMFGYGLGGGYGYGYGNGYGGGYYGGAGYGAVYANGYQAGYVDPNATNQAAMQTAPVDPNATSSGQQSPADMAADAAQFATAGETAFKSGDYQLATKDWRHAMVESPNNGVLALMLGQGLFATGSFDEAAGAVQYGMHLLPSDQWNTVVGNYTELYRGNQDYTDQLRALETAAAKKDAPGLEFLLGYNYGYLGYPKQAVTSLDKVLTMNPQDSTARQLRALFASKLKPGEVPDAPAAPATPAGAPATPAGPSPAPTTTPQTAG
ncbi:MAG TPA: hypothetical protein VHZ24_13430 [Pirellulales bacterium]|nr:hypothetical protein [Pirellulales bacterium]